MTPPRVAAWNLVLRFTLELAAFAGLAVASWSLSTGATRWVVVVSVPLAAAVVWGVFNVIDDPSRSGKAPVEVSGRVRLVVEVLILGGGAAAFAGAARPEIAIVFAILIVVHYATSWSRIEWLVDQ